MNHESIFSAVRSACGTKRDGDSFTVHYSELLGCWLIVGDHIKRQHRTREEAVKYANAYNRLWRVKEIE